MPWIVNWGAHVACNFNCLVETEVLFRVTCSHVHYKSGSIWEMVQGRDPQITNRKWYMADQIVVVLITSSDLEGLAPNWLVAWSSGRTLVLGRHAFAVLRSACSWWVTTFVGKPSATGQPTRPTQRFILSRSIWVVSSNRVSAVSIKVHLTNAYGVKAWCGWLGRWCAC